MKHVQASKKVALDSESKVADESNVKQYILTEKPINLLLIMLYFFLLTIFTLRWSQKDGSMICIWYYIEYMEHKVYNVIYSIILSFDVSFCNQSCCPELVCVQYDLLSTLNHKKQATYIYLKVVQQRWNNCRRYL